MTHNEKVEKGLEFNILQGRAAQNLEGIEKALSLCLQSKIPFATAASQRTIQAGGKRLRPLLIALIFEAIRNLPSDNKTASRGTLEDLHYLGAVAELVHTATLFHDDVLDASATRRDQSTAHVLYGNKNAILLGDFVYAEAFHQLMKRSLLEPSQTLAETVRSVVEGELLQHTLVQNRDLSFEDYQFVARAKTGTLFGWCTSTGAWLAGAEAISAAHVFGLQLGYAFQLADDLIDTFELNPLTASTEEINSWVESAAPLPIVLAARESTSVEKLWKQVASIKNPTERMEAILELQRQSGQMTLMTQALSLIDEALLLAKNALKELHIESEMDWAIDIISARAHSGVAMSQTATVSQTNTKSQATERSIDGSL